MKLKALKYMGIGLVASISSFSAQAELIDQFPATQSEYANASVSGASVNLYIDDTGVNQTITLAVRTGWGSAYTYWRGVISAADVTINGISEIAVNTDTCAYTPVTSTGNDACGRVDVTFSKGDFLFRTDGNVTFDWAPLVNTITGGITVFDSQVSGFVKGVDMSGAFRPAMGKYTNVKVVVELPDAAS